jgi:hypothetical protein
LPAEARAKGAGVWGVSAYRVIAADNLNFDKDWHRNFTVLIERKDNDTLKAAGIDAKALAGKRLRVRSWIECRNGPMIHSSRSRSCPMPELPRRKPRRRSR